MAYLGEHDVRFFEGFLARDAALLHTSDGQLETALTLFGTSIEAFLRSGAVAQLVITLASLPALFERLDRPASRAPCSARWPGEPASFHHVPALAELGERLDAQLGEEAAGAVRRQPAPRWTSTTPRPTPSTRSTWPARLSTAAGQDAAGPPA